MIAVNVIKNFCYALENQITFITQDLEENDFTSKSSSAPAIGWIICHIMVSYDYIVNHCMLGNNVILSQEMFLNYNTGSSGEIKGSFNSTEIMNDFKNITKTIVDQLMIKDDSWLEESPVNTKNFPKQWLNKNNMKVLVLFFNHALNHTGQIMELKRGLGKRVWGV